MQNIPVLSGSFYKDGGNIQEHNFIMIAKQTMKLPIEIIIGRHTYRYRNRLEATKSNDMYTEKPGSPKLRKICTCNIFHSDIGIKRETVSKVCSHGIPCDWIKPL